MQNKLRNFICSIHDRPLFVIRRSLVIAFMPALVAVAVTNAYLISGHSQTDESQKPEPADRNEVPGHTRPPKKDKRDIRTLSQHFLDRNGDVSPWIFSPKDNIASMSTTEHGGVLTLWEAGRGKDIKGLLE